MKHDTETEARIAEAFETVGDALIQILSAAQHPDWEVRHRAAEHFGKSAVKVYRALCEEGA